MSKLIQHHHNLIVSFAIIFLTKSLHLPKINKRGAPYLIAEINDDATKIELESKCARDATFEDFAAAILNDF